MRLRLPNINKQTKAVGSFVSQTLQLILAVVGFFTTSVGLAFIAAILHLQFVIIPLLTFAAGVCVATTCAILFILKIRSSSVAAKTPSPLLPPAQPTVSRWLLRGYKCVEAEATYQIHEADPKHHTITIKTEIEANQSGVNIFEGTYRWTGKGSEELPRSITPGHVFLGPAEKLNGWKYYYIHLGQGLREGDKALIHTIQELHDNSNEFEPYLSRTIVVPTDSMLLRVILPRTYPLNEITFSEWDKDGPEGIFIASLQGETHQHTHEAVLKIADPILHHRYEIRWKNPDKV